MADNNPPAPVESTPVENMEKPKPKPNLKDRTRNICKRFWWLFLLVAAILLLIIILPIVYVAYPKAARHAVRDSQLGVTHMAIFDPTPEGVELTVVEKFLTNSSYHPTLYPFNASLYLLDPPGNNVSFASIQTNTSKAYNNAVVTIGPKRINITHMEEFTKFVLLVANSEEFTYAIRGHGDLREGGLPKVHVDYDKNITMKGLNGLKSFSLQSFYLLNDTQPDGTNANGIVSIFNPSVMTIALGNVTLALSVNGTSIGTAALPDLVLQSGQNNITMRAEVYKLVAAAIALERKQTILPVDIQGNGSTFQGRQIPYYTTMLSQTWLQVDLDVTKAMEGPQ